MSEKAIENSIKRYLDSIGAWYIKTHGSIFSKAGTPDILACVKGKFVAIEVKRPGGVVSALQEANIKLIEQAGGVALIVYSLEETQQHLEELNIV